MPLHSSMRSVMLSLPAALLMVACSGGPHAPAGGKQSAASSSGPAASRAQTVVIRGFKYQPPILTVKVGDSVKWKNDDIVPHTVTSPEVNHTRAFDSGRIAIGSSWQWVAGAPGTYEYICTPHPNMKGQLVVQ